ncbi:HPF/RaiA family ribosome-associated protein [Candidatus Dependentiae bacterium]|nr:HPF/RaiA family ribosome-associated protein [Candidatus Dependentiae bacterium]
MNKKIHFQGMDSSVAIENYINDRLPKIEEFLKDNAGPVYIDFTVRPGIPHAHSQAELRVKTPHHEVMALKEGPHAYQLIDMVIDSVYDQLHEHKRRMTADKKNGNNDYFKGA